MAALYFNTSGMCIPGEHYMLPPERRLGRVRELIEQRRYFTLHAGHQTGKTTSAKWLARHFNSGERYHALWVDLQTARETPDPAAAFPVVLELVDESVRRTLPDLGVPAARDRLLDTPSTALLRYLGDLAARSKRPLVMLFDEVDCLVGATMVSFLTQLRSGYLARDEAPFPHSVALIGRHIALSWLGSASSFNISAEATTIGLFTEPEAGELLAQHTAETGQRFELRAGGRGADLRAFLSDRERGRGRGRSARAPISPCRGSKSSSPAPSRRGTSVFTSWGVDGC